MFSHQGFVVVPPLLVDVNFTVAAVVRVVVDVAEVCAVDEDAFGDPLDAPTPFTGLFPGLFPWVLSELLEPSWLLAQGGSVDEDFLY